MVVLHLIRHGETDWNRDRRVQGSSDVPLNDAGRAQARAAAERFAAMTERPAAVVTSDLARAGETADILASVLGLPAPRRYASLRERGYGDAEGMSAPDVVARWGDWATQDVPGAEAWGGVRARGLRAIDEVVAGLDAPPPVSVIVVTHGALLRQIVLHVTDGELPAPEVRLGNTEGVQLAVDGGRMRVVGPSPSPLPPAA